MIHLILMVAAPTSPEFSPVQLLPLVLIIPLIAFWLWMFRDMLGNDNLPGNLKQTWTFAFIIFNVFAAVVYYAFEYRNKQ